MCMLDHQRFLVFARGFRGSEWCVCMQSVHMRTLTPGECGVFGDMSWNRHVGHHASCSAVTSFCAAITRCESVCITADYNPKRRPSRPHSLWYDACLSVYVHSCLVRGACVHLKHTWVHTCNHTHFRSETFTRLTNIPSPPHVSRWPVHALPLYTLTNVVGAYYFNWYNIENQWKRYSQTRHPVLGHYNQSVRKCICFMYICMFMYMLMHSNIVIYLSIHTYVHTTIHTHTLSHTNSLIHTHTYTHTNAHT